MTRNYDLIHPMESGRPQPKCDVGTKTEDWNWTRHPWSCDLPKGHPMPHYGPGIPGYRRCCGGREQMSLHRESDPLGDIPSPLLMMGQVTVNEYGTLVSLHRCWSCGSEFTVCPPQEAEVWGGCLAEGCGSYDGGRDVDWMFG